MSSFTRLETRLHTKCCGKLMRSRKVVLRHEANRERYCLKCPHCKVVKSSAFNRRRHEETCAERPDVIAKGKARTYECLRASSISLDKRNKVLEKKLEKACQAIAFLQKRCNKFEKAFERVRADAKH